MNVVQIVKKFGPVGGMEEYAYRLTQELFKLGCNVTVLCEKNCATALNGIDIIELGEHSKPHWLSHYRFSAKVNHWLTRSPLANRIVHSHERQSMHHVSTFHTTPFNLGKHSVSKFLSLRNFFYEKLEKRELFGHHAHAIVPVSNSLGDLIRGKHPEAHNILKRAIHPGVDLRLSHAQSKCGVPSGGGTLGFIGKEWERKGLPKAINIWRELKKIRPNLKLRVAGVSSEVVSHLIEKPDTNIEILGFVKEKESFYQSIDLLLHPAKLEAFGMVIGEALSMQVPVLCSSECGAAEILKGKDGGGAISCNAKLHDWVGETEALLSSSQKIYYQNEWSFVAKLYMKMYRKIL